MAEKTMWAEVDKEGRLVLPAEFAALFGLAPGARMRIEPDVNALRLHRPIQHLAFGAFIELEEGIEGLCHVSELDEKHVEKPTEFLNIGQEVEMKIRLAGAIALALGLEAPGVHVAGAPALQTLPSAPGPWDLPRILGL